MYKLLHSKASNFLFKTGKKIPGYIISKQIFIQAYKEYFVLNIYFLKF